MSEVEAYRQLVEARAGGACEYCRLLLEEIELTIPRTHILKDFEAAQAGNGPKEPRC
jgi:hypothetical protein